jgi:hypothetical protein
MTGSGYCGFVGPLPVRRGGPAAEFAPCARGTPGRPPQARRQDLDTSSQRPRGPLLSRHHRTLVLSTRPGVSCQPRRRCVREAKGVGSRFRATTVHLDNLCPKTTPDPFRRSTKKYLAGCLQGLERTAAALQRRLRRQVAVDRGVGRRRPAAGTAAAPRPGAVGRPDPHAADHRSRFPRRTLRTALSIQDKSAPVNFLGERVRAHPSPLPQIVADMTFCEPGVSLRQRFGGRGDRNRTSGSRRIPPPIWRIRLRKSFTALGKTAKAWRPDTLRLPRADPRRLARVYQYLISHQL